jgi:membrane-bound lytic murein transglycosylase D
VDRVAALAEVDVQKVRLLNPELQSDRLPPSKAPYYVRLPHGTYPTFAENFAALPEAERTPEIKHVLQPGETIGQVADRYHVERSALLEKNGGGYPVTMHVGERLSIPETQYAGNARIAESADAQPLRIQYGSRTVRPVAGTSPNTELTAALSAP